MNQENGAASNNGHDDGDDWLSQYFEQAVYISRKRKAPGVSSLECDHSHSDDESDSSSDSASSRSKSPRLADTFVAGSSESLGMDDKFVARLMKYLTVSDIRSMKVVSKTWNSAGNNELRLRNGTRPFTHLWKSTNFFEQTRFKMERFVSPILSGPFEVDTVLLVGTSSMDLDDLAKYISTFQHNVKYIAGFTDSLITTTPDQSFVCMAENSTTEKLFMMNALCIPSSRKITINSFAIPVCDSGRATTVAGLREIVGSFDDAVKIPAGSNLDLLGIVTLDYALDPLVVNLISNRLNSAPNPVYAAGGILENISSNSNNDEGESIVSCGLAIFGSDQDARVLSIALNINGVLRHDLESDVYPYMGDFFNGMTGGFILFFYTKAVSTAESSLIMKRIRGYTPGIPVIGVQTIQNISFQGNVPHKKSGLLNIPFESSLTFGDIRVSCFLLAY